MEDGLARGRFVEFGEYRGNLYGTAQESILSIINSGQVCVLCPHYQVSWGEVLWVSGGRAEEGCGLRDVLRTGGGGGR